MSYAEIVGGGADGRYTIKLDWGEARKAQLLAQVAAAQAKLTQQLAQQQQHVDAAKAGEAQSLANLQAFQDALIAGMGPVQGAGPSDSAKRLYDEMLERHRQLVLSHQPARDALAKLKVQVAQANAMAAYWNNFVAAETRPAWCCDLTENASGYVATVDIPGENNLILIAPGGRGWQPSDGVLTAREIMSPEQAFLNAAILPGVQKWHPRYRTGKITSIDYDAGTCSVALDDARSSAQRLPVNARSSFSDVPIVYMTCNAGAFVEGDNVVVEIGADWGSATVIGFTSYPRECTTYTVVVMIDGVDGGTTVYAAKAPNFLIPPHTAPASDGYEETDYHSRFGRLKGWYKDNVYLAGTDREYPAFRVSRAMLSPAPLSPNQLLLHARSWHWPRNLAAWLGNEPIVSVDTSTTWTLTSTYLPPPPAPPLYTWDWVVHGTMTLETEVWFGFGKWAPNMPAIALTEEILAVPLSKYVWTTDHDPDVVSGGYSSNDPGAGGGNIDPTAFEPAIYPNRTPLPQIAELCPVVVIQTIYGAARYVLETAITRTIAQYVLLEEPV